MEDVFLQVSVVEDSCVFKHTQLIIKFMLF